MNPARPSSKLRVHPGPAPGEAVDPVCGMTVIPGQAAGGSHVHAGTTYHFCSPSCRTRFAANPEAFLGKPPVAMEPAPPAAGRSGDARIYTCPMHPEVQQVGPGSCPICGMALEPQQVTLRRGPQPRAGRHDPAAVGQRRADGAAGAAGHVGDAAGPARARRPGAAGDGLAAAGAGHAGGAVGRLAVLRARLGVAGAAPAEHVHADRARHRGGLPVQRGRHAGAGPAARRRPRPRRRGARCTSRRRRSSSRWCCWGRCWSCGPGRPPPAPSARCWTSPAHRPRACATTASDEDVPLAAVAAGRPPAGAAGREGARSTAWCRRAASAVDESMLTGEPMPVEKAPGRPR